MRLIAYVGPSKTGSTSLAAALRRSQVVLETAGAQYWGPTLDLAPFVGYDWQRHQPSERLLEATRDDDHFRSQFVDAVQQGFQAGAEAGIRHAIIVNDSWMDGRWRDRAIDILQAVADELPVTVVVVAYVRSPSAYAQSAYAQWELKHKVHPGPIRAWPEGAERYILRFAEHMEAFDRAFGKRFLLRNYEATDDVVGDFLEAVGLEHVPLPALASNVRPSTEEELVQAFYNTLQQDSALPQEFRSFADIDFNHDVIAWYQDLLPTRAAIRATAMDLREDLRRMNALLAARGQPAIRDKQTMTRDGKVDPNRLISAFCKSSTSSTRGLKPLRDS